MHSFRGNMNKFRFWFVPLWVLLWPDSLLACEWSQDPAPGSRLGLDWASMAAGAKRLGWIPDVSDPDLCRELCCDEPDCDLALLGKPADTKPQCLLLSCWSGDRDVCVLRPDGRFILSGRKLRRSRREAPEAPKATSTDEPEPKSDGPDYVRCRLPVKVGSCRAAFPRFYYNVSTRSCHAFTYGGCEANSNNFDTEEECKKTCGGVTGSVLPDESTPSSQLPVKAARMAPSITSPDESELAATESVPVQRKEMSATEFSEYCEAEPEMGPCRAAFRHWFYDRKKGSCQSFVYGGCRGNQNNYASEELCKASCADVTVLPSTKSDQPSADCLSSPDPGPCRAAFPVFYYNAETDACQLFTYGGCLGNLNRYGSQEECLSVCSGDGSLAGRARSRWNAASFLLFTLAAISALLLGALVVFMLRRHRPFGRASSISDKEELLPDPKELSFQESLTVPDSPTMEKA